MAVFTVTLFLSNKGEISFESLNSDESITSFFEEHFADALLHMPNLLEDFRDNPVGLLGTVRCFPWSLGSCGLLLGDAATRHRAILWSRHECFF